METLDLILGLLVLATLLGGMVVILVVTNLSKTAATKVELGEMEDRFESKMEGERIAVNAANIATHRRIDAQSEKISELIGETRAVGKNVEKLLDKGLA